MTFDELISLIFFGNIASSKFKWLIIFKASKENLLLCSGGKNRENFSAKLLKLNYFVLITKRIYRRKGLN